MDLIDRQEAIKAMTSGVILVSNDSIKAVTEVIEFFTDKIKNLPSAQPERKTGRWLQISPAGIYECSECGQTVMTKDISCYKFCHGCGAYMGGDTE